MEILTRAALLCAMILTSSINVLYEYIDLYKIHEPFAATIGSAKEHRVNKSQKVNLLIDFSDYSDGPVDEWLKTKGFKFEHDAKDRESLALSIDNGVLVLEAKKPIRAFLVNEDGRSSANTLRI